MRARLALVGALMALVAGCATGPGTLAPSSTTSPTAPATATADPCVPTATVVPSSTTCPPTSTPSTPPTSPSTSSSPRPSTSTVAKPTTSTSTSAKPTTSTPTPTTTTSPPTTPAPRTASVVSVLPTSAKVVALTFDGGADSRGAASILATLRREGVPASFFVTGRFVQAYPTVVAQLATIGPVGNHTWDHPHLPTLSDAQVLSQLDRTRSAIIATTGKDPIPFFRFPFGDSDAHARALVAAHGYQAVGWTVDSLGWKGTSGGMTAAKVLDRVVAAARPGEIVLMHLGANPDDNTTLDADALPQIISRLRSLGYSFVTLDSLR